MNSTDENDPPPLSVFDLVERRSRLHREVIIPVVIGGRSYYIRDPFELQLHRIDFLRAMIRGIKP